MCPYYSQTTQGQCFFAAKPKPNVSSDMTLTYPEPNHKELDLNSLFLLHTMPQIEKGTFPDLLCV